MLVFAIFPRPALTRVARAFAPPRWLPLPRMLRPLLDIAPPRGWIRREEPPERTLATGKRRAKVGLLTGCVQRVVFGGVNAATARVLAAEGFEVVAPLAQGCCGVLHVHAGRRAAGL